MADKKYHTIPDIVQFTGISETTIRRYINTFSDFLEYKQYGRIKKYNGESVDLLKTINNYFSSGKTTQEIFEILDRDNDRIIEMPTDNHITTMTPQEQFLKMAEMQTEAFKQIAAAIEKISEQENTINNLKQEIQCLREQQQEQESHINNRDKEILERMRLMLEQEQKKKGFWDWFKRN